MNEIIDLTDDQKSEVAVVYRMYKRGKWYHSETPLPGYDKYYYSNKSRIEAYYKNRESAEREVEKYNKRLIAYEKGRFPKHLTWDMFIKTELHKETVWWHGSGSWLYAHGYDDWVVEELFEDSMDFEYDDYKHTTANFFEVMFGIPKFSSYEIKKDDNGEYKIRKKG